MTPAQFTEIVGAAGLTACAVGGIVVAVLAIRRRRAGRADCPRCRGFGGDSGSRFNRCPACGKARSDG